MHLRQDLHILVTENHLITVTQHLQTLLSLVPDPIPLGHTHCSKCVALPHLTTVARKTYSMQENVFVTPKAKSNLNASGYLPACGALAWSWDSHPGEEKALIVLQTVLGKEEALHHMSEPRGTLPSQADLVLSKAGS